MKFKDDHVSLLAPFNSEMLKLEVPCKSFRYDLDKTRPAEVALIFRYTPAGNPHAIILHLPTARLPKKKTQEVPSSYFLSCPCPNLQLAFKTTEYCKTPFPCPGHPSISFFFIKKILFVITET